MEAGGGNVKVRVYLGGGIESLHSTLTVTVLVSPNNPVTTLRRSVPEGGEAEF
jgi:hypothetical protein